MTVALYLLGLASVVVGAFLFSIPLGFVVLGSAIAAAGWLTEEVDS